MCLCGVLELCPVDASSALTLLHLVEDAANGEAVVQTGGLKSILALADSDGLTTKTYVRTSTGSQLVCLCGDSLSDPEPPRAHLPL